MKFCMPVMAGLAKVVAVDMLHHATQMTQPIIISIQI